MAGATRPTRTAGVLGLGHHLPETVVSNLPIAERLGIDESWIVKRTGIQHRRHAMPSERLSDLAIEAGRNAVKDAGVDPTALDAVLVATTSAFSPSSNAAGLFVLLGAEFLAMILVVVYVGAVAVLFLFVVMMLDVDFVELRQGFLNYLPVGALVGIVLLAELLIVLGGWVFAPDVPMTVAVPIQEVDEVSNTAALGRVLYTRYIYFFQVAGLILLVAMVGAIVLTLFYKESAERQSIADQVARTPATSIEYREVELGQGPGMSVGHSHFVVSTPQTTPPERGRWLREAKAGGG